MEDACKDFNFCNSNLNDYKEKTASEAFTIIKQKGDMLGISNFLSLYSGLKSTALVIQYRDSMKLEFAIAQ